MIHYPSRLTVSAGDWLNATQMKINATQRAPVTQVKPYLYHTCWYVAQYTRLANNDLDNKEKVLTMKSSSYLCYFDLYKHAPSDPPVHSGNMFPWSWQRHRVPLLLHQNLTHTYNISMTCSPQTVLYYIDTTKTHRRKLKSTNHHTDLVKCITYATNNAEISVNALNTVMPL